MKMNNEKLKQWQEAWINSMPRNCVPTEVSCKHSGRNYIDVNIQICLIDNDNLEQAWEDMIKAFREGIK